MLTGWHPLAFGAGLWLGLGVGSALAWQEREPARLPPPVSESKLAALAETAELQVEDVRSASFKKVRLGQATADEAKKLLGEPARVETQNTVSTWTYRIDPFSRVDLLLTDGVATSVVIHLKRPAAAAQMAKDLNLDSFRPAPIPDENGQLLGIAYPERGVTFGLLPDARENPVSHVLLEAVSAEPFVLRVLYDVEHRYRHNLADLTYAARLDPRDPRIPWLKAQTLAAMGRQTDALASAAEAVKLEPASAEYRLTHAWLLGETGAYEQAIAETRAILARQGLPPEIEPRAECLWGDLLAWGPTKNYKEAIEHHQAAVKLATRFATDRRFAVRRAAKQTLVDANLGVAGDIAWGPWKRKSEVAPKWLARAESHAQDFFENDRGDAKLKLLVYRKTLAAQAGLGDQADPTAAATLVLSESRKLLEGKSDPFFRRQVAWELGEAMHDAARIAQARGQAEEALAYLQRALPLLEQDLANRPATTREQYLLGNLASMCKALGQDAQAKEYAALAAKNGGPDQPKRR